MKYGHIVFDHDGTLVHPESLQLYPGIRPLLALLQQNGAKLYVWTARNRHSTVEILRSLAIIQCFEDLSTCTDCESKPSPQGLVNMLGEVSKHDVVVIGDSFADMIGARNFQVASLGANWHEKSEDNARILNHFGARRVFAEVQELQNFLIE